MKKLCVLFVIALIVMGAGNAMAWDWAKRIEVDSESAESEIEYWTPDYFQYRSITDRYYVQAWVVGGYSYALVHIGRAVPNPPYDLYYEAQADGGAFDDDIAGGHGYFDQSGEYGYHLHVIRDTSVSWSYATAAVDLDAY